MHDLATAIRTWRTRLTPSEAGLPPGADRRTPGLRREELAYLAGISVDYLVRLEQGRACNPSHQVMMDLADALHLNSHERELLFRVSAAVPVAEGVISRQLTPGVERILDRLSDSPVAVYTAGWDFVQSNHLWEALFEQELDLTARQSNLVRRVFNGVDLPVLWSEVERRSFQQTLVGDLHTALSAYPNDPQLVEVITKLREESSDFEVLWSQWSISRPPAQVKKLRVPRVGIISLHCDILATHDTDLRIIIYTADPGSEDAKKLRELGRTGA